jgi:polysaccharide export outer membrane protein
MRSICFTALWLLLCGLPAQAQQARLLLQTDFAIGAADLLEISVLGVADFSRELQVSGEGTIRMPFLGDLEVEGLTCRQLETKLAKLLDPQYVKDPQVSVSIKEPRSRMFSLMGAVMKPGQYQILEQVTLVSAIAGAGGLDFVKAGDKITIQRSYRLNHGSAQSATAQVSTDDTKTAPAYQIEVDLKKLLMAGDMSLDVPIMPGDVINIPQRETRAVYVIGDVNKPGPFDFPNDRGINLSRALAMAGGPTKTSKLGNSSLIREKADGSMDKIVLDLGKVLKGKAPDIELQPNDLIYVPSSVGKSLGWATITTLPASILTRLVIY